MKIIVAIKQVPERDAQVRIDSAGKWIEEADLQFAMNESDAYALEEALQLKEKHGGEVVVLSAGPERAGSPFAKPSPKAPTAPFTWKLTISTSAMRWASRSYWPAAAKPESPDLVLTGLQSDDLGYGQTGVIMAELLGLPHASLILHVDKTEAGLTVKRELEEGWFQNIELPLPAVLMIQSGGNKLRYATLMGIKKAKTKELRKISATDLGQANAPAAVLEKITLPQKQKSTQIIPGSAKEAAATLVEKLKFEVRVI